jgi:hypothetical protein
MKKVYVTSPYASYGGRSVEHNVQFAIACSRYVIAKGHMPIAVHLLYPRILDDNDPKERDLGLQFGRQLLESCDELWYFGSHISAGMQQEIEHAFVLNIPVKHITSQDVKIYSKWFHFPVALEF